MDTLSFALINNIDYLKYIYLLKNNKLEAVKKKKTGENEKAKKNFKFNQFELLLRPLKHSKKNKKSCNKSIKKKREIEIRVCIAVW